MSITVTAVMAEGKRPVTFRTRKLSPPAPMVLHSGGCGRVGHRRTQPPVEGRPHPGSALTAYPTTGPTWTIPGHPGANGLRGGRRWGSERIGGGTGRCHEHTTNTPRRRCGAHRVSLENSAPHRSPDALPVLMRHAPLRPAPRWRHGIRKDTTLVRCERAPPARDAGGALRDRCWQCRGSQDDSGSGPQMKRGSAA